MAIFSRKTPKIDGESKQIDDKPKVVSVKRSKKPIFVGLAVIAAIIVVLGGYFVYDQFFAYKGSEAATKEDNESSSIGNSLRADGDLEKAKADYDELADSVGDKDQKARYLQAKARLCAEKQDYTCAIEAFEASDQLVGETYLSAWTKAVYAKDSGDKQRAKEFYDRAVQLAESDSENIDAKADLEAIKQERDLLK